jgi:8-oxo-dGTP pyrophosphatase MutT (NUDIX family)
MKYRKKLTCLNCDVQGHTFKNCVLPIRSYGIIAYKYEHGEIKYLLIQRKDTIGKTDFIRGKYKINGKIDYNKLTCLVNEMTDIEKVEILSKEKSQIWSDLWLDHNTGIYKNEKFKALKLFDEIDYREILLSSIPSRYNTNEWSFPKGRKNLYESSLECARREFVEETGLNYYEFEMNINNSYIEEFTASDNKKYMHIYYLAEIKQETEVNLLSKDLVFKQEVRDIGFFPFKTAYKLFRDYDTANKETLLSVSI